MEFSEYWQQTDIIIKSLFFILFGLSIVSWMAGLTRIYLSLGQNKVVSDVLKQAVNEQSQLLSKLDGAAERKTVVEQTLMKKIGQYRNSSEKGMAIVGTTAAIAPFIGLFGTVWGIYHALRNIGVSGQAGLSQVAGPVGEALIMTGIGLAVAIPAVVFYNICLRINRKTIYTANDTAYGLLRDSVVEYSAKASNTVASTDTALTSSKQSSSVMQSNSSINQKTASTLN